MENKESEKKPLDRRKFLVRLSLSLGSIPAILISIPVISALINPLRTMKPQVWRKVGSITDFPLASTTLVKFKVAKDKPWGGESTNTGVWLRRKDEDEWEAFSLHCTHLGCPVRWKENAQLFMCPCHGGTYNKNGTPASGPPLTALKKYKVRTIGTDVEVKTEPLPITKITGKSFWTN